MMSIPKCRYCKKSLPFWIDREHGKRGRAGRGLFCSLACTEEWATYQLTGSAVPRGDSHGRKREQQQ